MSAQGFTPPRSEPATASEGATSSSHQPPLKTLRALEAAEEAGSSPRVLNSSTDGEDTKEQEGDALPVPKCPVLSPRPESSALPVPHAPLQEEDDAQGEENHNADMKRRGVFHQRGRDPGNDELERWWKWLSKYFGCFRGSHTP